MTEFPLLEETVSAELNGNGHDELPWDERLRIVDERDTTEASRDDWTMFVEIPDVPLPETNAVAVGQTDRRVDGASFILDIGKLELPALWGTTEAPLWVAGEPLLIAGPDGVGKTSIAQQLVLARIGIRQGLFGLDVKEDDRPVLYLALDRPRQIARSFARMVTDDDRLRLRERLIVWQGPLAEDIAAEETHLEQLAVASGAGTVVIDSLKDAAVGLSKDDIAAKVNRALQRVVAADIELAATHHQRKANDGNRKPNKLSDVYGSRWLTAGMGSVLMVWGDAGDLIVDLTHLKQPSESVGPLTLVHDHTTGTTTAEERPTLESILTAAGSAGVTVADVARQVFGGDDRNAVERARRLLQKLDAADKADRHDDADSTARYFARGIVA